MKLVAFKMLIGNRAAFIGVIFGIFLAILLISQQSAIFIGLISRSYRIVTHIPSPNIWVIDPNTYGEDVIRSMPRDYLEYVRNIPNVDWAVPVNYLEAQLSTPTGIFEIAEVYGIDDETLLGAPTIIEGNIHDLHNDGAIILDINAAQRILAKTLEDKKIVPLKLGDELEINGHRSVIVGIGKMTPGFYPQPIVFTANSQFQKYSGSNRIQYIAAKTHEKADESRVIKKINSYSNVLALTREQLSDRMAEHFLKTGIFINFALSLALGLIIGFSITGQIFYMMTMHNLHYYALIKAIGGTGKMILSMIVTQALIVGIIGYILGTGVTMLWGFAIKNTSLAFEFPWQLLVFTGIFTLIICLFTVILSVQKVFRLDPKILMNL